jgi:hypothetical protein
MDMLQAKIVDQAGSRACISRRFAGGTGEVTPRRRDASESRQTCKTTNIRRKTAIGYIHR